MVDYTKWSSSSSSSPLSSSSSSYLFWPSLSILAWVRKKGGYEERSYLEYLHMKKDLLDTNIKCSNNVILVVESNAYLKVFLCLSFLVKRDWIHLEGSRTTWKLLPKIFYFWLKNYQNQNFCNPQLRFYCSS